MTINPKLLEPTLLWSNPNPSGASFNAQTITLTVNASPYKYVFIEFKRDSEAYGTIYTEKMKKNDAGTVDGAVVIGKRTRSFRVRTNTYCDFGGATPIDSTTENNSMCIPIAIYGTNIL